LSCVENKGPLGSFRNLRGVGALRTDHSTLAFRTAAQLRLRLLAAIVGIVG
jgi:hypothetical protein